MLALHEAYRMWVTKDTHVRSMEEVAEINPDWENTVFNLYAHLRFHEDSIKDQNGDD